MIEVSIVSGTYNRLNLLKQMVHSVRNSTVSISHELILVDGGSTDGTLEWVKEQQDIRLIEHGKLLGAIKAYADGAAIARGEYVVFSNDDLHFVGDAIARALGYMRNHPETGIGCFYTNRANRGWHVAEMPAHYPDGRMTNAFYGGIIIIPRWLGNKLNWWALSGARTYGGDNALCARAIEAGWPVKPIEFARVSEVIPGDGLNLINNVPQSNNHPDTAAYLSIFPSGPELGHARQFEAPAAPLHILYAPIYEKGHRVQHFQKRGLRRALQRIGIVREVDYVETGPDSILTVAEAFRPDLVVTQFHGGQSFGPERARRLRELLPNARLINWNGDAHDPADEALYIETLRYFDLLTVVNASHIARFMNQGIRTVYWQIGFEPDGVGYAIPPRQTWDAVFLGSGYSAARHQFASFLRSTGYHVGLFGTGWPGGAIDTTYDFAAGRAAIQSAKLVLGDGQYPHSYGFVSNRLFQSLAAGGAMLLHQEFPGMTELLGLKDGMHLVTWRDHDDLRDKMAYYLDPAHEAERVEIARAGQQECLKSHSFERRVQQLQDTLTRLENIVPGIDSRLIGVEYA